MVRDAFKNHFAAHFKQLVQGRLKLNISFTNRLSSEQVVDMDRSVSQDEIRMAVWNYGENKSPGPDGPISLIGCVYKVVTKVLAIRLATVISDLVSDTQSAFVANRQILDGPFILNELLTWYKNKKKQVMFFKVDFAKAYDSEMEAIRSKFFNGADISDRKITWAASDKVLTSNKNGGLGVSTVYGSSFDLHSVNQPSIWRSILREVHLLKSKGFPRLFALETDKEATVAAKLGASSTDVSFRMAVRDGAERQQWSDLNSLSGSVSLSSSKDRWICDLTGDGDFRVKEVRNTLDDLFLPSQPDATRWVKYIPIKINVFAWRVWLNIEKLDGNIVQKHGGSKQVGFKQLGLGVETGVHGVSNDDTAVAQRWLEDKQPKEKTNTNCLVKEQEKEYQAGWKIKTGNVLDSFNQRSTQQILSVHGFWAEDTTMSTYLVNRSPSSAIGFKTPIDMLGIFGWLSSIKQGMLEPVKVKCIFMGYHKGIVGNKLWRFDDVTSKVVLYRNMGFNESGDYKKTFIGSGIGELWNWKHPKSIDFQAKRGFSARDSYIIPISSNEITSSEEYTCVVSIKDGCPIMTHSYCDKVIDCHPIPCSMVAATLGGGNHPLVYAAEYPDDSKFEECLKRCYICNKIIKQMSNTPAHKNGDFDDKIGLDNVVKATNEKKDNKKYKP
ncbi:hypothetical protein Tco_0352163 [Tanacetum coccineum]